MTKTNVPSNAAREFTLEYLSTLEDTLRINFTDTGSPIFTPGRISEDQLKKLWGRIDELTKSVECDRAIADVASYGLETRVGIQTTAVGLWADFDLAVKLGVLLGDRLVLWDTVLRSILQGQSSRHNIDTLGHAVNGLLRMRPIIKNGALVLLPQPRIWLERARAEYTSMPPAVAADDALKGLISAGALHAEGFRLHPYVCKSEAAHDRFLRELVAGMVPYYSAMRSSYHEGLLRIFTAPSLGFISDIEAPDFYRAVTRIGQGALRKLQYEMAERLSYPYHRLSPEERARFLDDAVAAIETYTSEVDRGIRAHKGETAFSGLGAIKATFGIAGDAASGGALAAAVSGLGAIGAVGAFLKKTLAGPSRPFLYQVFTELKRARTKGINRELNDQGSIPGFVGPAD